MVRRPWNGDGDEDEGKENRIDKFLKGFLTLSLNEKDSLQTESDRSAFNSLSLNYG